MKQELTISIDFDGTLWSHMKFFRAFMLAMQAHGNRVGMLTGHNVGTETADINLMLARGFPRPDFWLGRRPEYQHLNGSHFKAAMIERHNIDIHFDDCDFGNPESARILMEHPIAKDRVFVVRWKEPRNAHFE